MHRRAQADRALATRRADLFGVLFGWLARGGLLALWSCVAWGSLLLVVTAVGAAGQGLRTALARLLPSFGAPLWAWLNGVSAALALAVWLVLAGLLVHSWIRRSGSAASTPDTPPPPATPPPPGA